MTSSLKSALRQEYILKRQSLDRDYVRAATEQINRNIVELIVSSPETIAGYSAIRAEVSIEPALLNLASRGFCLCLPVVESNEMPLSFRLWDANTSMVQDKYGIFAPNIEQPIVIPDTLLVPLVAFDRWGQRLGYGAGFYDRTIEQLRKQKKGLKVIGVGFSLQEIDEIPSEPHDAKLDMIITQKEIRTF